MFRILMLLALSLGIYNCTTAQTTIDFSRTPYDGVHPHIGSYYFKESGCFTYTKWGPNPIPLNGHNIRVVGNTWYGRLGMVTYPALNLMATGNNARENFKNSVVSIEYPFAANKSYLIEMTGITDEIPLLDPPPQGKTNISGVFWIKLDNNAEIVNDSQNKCEASYSPVTKEVTRYSKLIADPERIIAEKKYQVKFSPLENKNALKIYYDPAPGDPRYSFTWVYRLKTVKITEMPYEDEKRDYPTYKNTPPLETLGQRSRAYPNIYNIPYSPPPRPTNLPTAAKNLSIASNQWLLSSDGISHHILLSTINPEIKMVELVVLNLFGDFVPGGRRGGYWEQFDLPATYKSYNYSYEMLGDDIIFKTSNGTSLPPPDTTKFTINYKFEFPD